MWTSLYNRGEMKIEEQSVHSARMTLRNFPSEIAGCARLNGWMQGLAELTGAKEFEIEHTRCFARGGEWCEWNALWK
jgi:predicted hydrocarbon binding protein